MIMTQKLSGNDHKKILKYYEIPFYKTKKKNKINSENILSDKLCKCIKKVSMFNKETEQIAIGICTKSIFSNRNLKYYNFKCKTPRMLSGLNKTKKIKLYFRSNNKTKRNKTKRNKTKRNKTKRNKTKRNKTKRNKTKRNKTKRNKTKRNKN